MVLNTALSILQLLKKFISELILKDRESILHMKAVPFWAI